MTRLGPILVVGLVLLMQSTALGADRDGDLLRDWTETRWGVTDPDDRDTDGDGVVDSAEDSDGDRLSDLGEQRFGTNPGKRDSDGDGRSDGAEDKDRDGISNAREQDQRRLPADLRPALGSARADRPERSDLCQTPIGSSQVLPCLFGDQDSVTSIAVFGDSHAEHWLPALDQAGDQEGWQITQLTKAACPSASALVFAQYRRDRGRACRQWRANAFQWLEDHRPDVIIISNSNRYRLINMAGGRVPADKQSKVWMRAMARTLVQLPQRSEIVVIADTPRMDRNPVRCLRAHRSNISACATQRHKAISNSQRSAERRAAVAAGAQTRNLSAKVCSYDPCPLVQGKTLIWRDRTHLTATFSRRLWPSMRDMLRSATDGTLGPAGRSR